MRVNELFDMKESTLYPIGSLVREFEPILLTPISNAVTTAVVATVAMAYGLPVVGGVGMAVGISAVVGLSLGTIMYYIGAKKRTFQSEYESFLLWLTKRDVLTASAKRVPVQQQGVYRKSISPALKSVENSIRLTGNRLIAQAKKIAQDIPDIREFKKRVRGAVAGVRKFTECSVLDDIPLNESAITATVAIYRRVTTLLRKGASARVSKHIAEIEKAGDDPVKLRVLFIKLQEYIAWDYVEDRIDREAYVSDTQHIQGVLAGLKEI